MGQDHTEEIRAYDPLVNAGDPGRLKRVMERASAGESITLVFLGGSITEGYSSTKPEYSYAARIHACWQQRFPKAEIVYVNAGIGATGSILGAARAERDVLSRRPDVVFVDFSVNDDNNEYMQETYEGLIRRLWLSGCAVVLLHFCFYDSGHSAEEVHAAVGRKYALPCISIRSSLYAQIADGIFKAEDISADMLHPNDEGHRRIAELVCDSLERLDGKALPAATGTLSSNVYEHARILQNADIDAELKGFVKDTKEAEYPADHFRGGWTAKDAGAEISFHFRCSEIAVQLRRTVKRPAPLAAAVVDGDEEHAIILDANFDQDWGDGLPVIPLMRHGQLLYGMAPEGESPVHYPDYCDIITEAGKKEAAAAEHSLSIRLLGTAPELGWKQGGVSEGGPAWIESKRDDSTPGFDLLAVITA